ncbi:alginate lyase family protein [Pararhizobium antarcticum]|uniref:Alginate lyase n=1 Tax=Pararhizobium antarcticum TaxID=1798805 RepID=A0A657LNS4_9HYPH|nr:alginate lyase family protein [Pararhizobium antarcticum]OJF91670.1 alginate lyase [Pararhizobium antarcticum]OJF96122.1 alginate lyase [Rhizobium sp. 58]
MKLSFRLRGHRTLMLGCVGALFSGSLLFTGVAAASGQVYRGLFDVESRKQALASQANDVGRKNCLAVAVDPKWADLAVIDGFKATAGYGTDRAGAEFAWAMMVLSGRVMAGDTQSATMLRNLLTKWAGAKAFQDTELSHDAYYALKRALLPTIVAFSIVKDGLTDDHANLVEQWLDPIVRSVDHRFDGEVDLNNHRYLADSVLMLWGAVVEDDELYAKGRDRFLSILSEARNDGSLPLETRRGARSLWYMRQSLTSMVVMAEVARGRGENLYDAESSDSEDMQKSIWTIFSYWLNGIRDPALVDAYAAENYIPGPETDYLKQDRGFLTKRSNGRHYLAFLEVLNDQPPSRMTVKRATLLLQDNGRPERPLIDEFVGGNATCFWGQT